MFTELIIENIKGIDSKNLTFHFHPNKPCILVAPNGFGKSSIACGFKSLKKSSLTIDEQNLHNENASLSPKLSIKVDNIVYEADASKNDISKEFDIFTINNPVYAKAKKQNFGGKFTTATASLAIDSITLIKSIPEKYLFDYSISEIRKSFGQNGKILANIKTEILDNKPILTLIKSSISFHQFSLKNFNNNLNNCKIAINSLNGDIENIKKNSATIICKYLNEYNDFIALSDMLEQKLGYSRIDAYLNSIQLASISQQPSFDLALNYAIYLNEKSFYDDLLSKINTTNKVIKSKEVKLKKTGTKKSLIVELPKINLMSNGQRDILTLISQLQQFKKESKKKQCILLIDEIFDYLDEANLVAFQYYITNIIEEFKSNGKKIYPILFTHLDPALFNHFCFSKHKMQISYLAKDPAKSSSKFLELVKNAMITALKTI